MAPGRLRESAYVYGLSESAMAPGRLRESAYVYELFASAMAPGRLRESAYVYGSSRRPWPPADSESRPTFTELFASAMAPGRLGESAYVYDAGMFGPAARLSTRRSRIEGPNRAFLPSPPVLRGRGVGGEGENAKPQESGSVQPPHPRPLSPGVPGERGEGRQRTVRTLYSASLYLASP